MDEEIFGQSETFLFSTRPKVIATTNCALFSDFYTWSDFT